MSSARGTKRSREHGAGSGETATDKDPVARFEECCALLAIDPSESGFELTAAKVDTAFRMQSKQNHPDKSADPDKKAVHARFCAIQDARDHLKSLVDTVMLYEIMNRKRRKTGAADEFKGNSGTGAAGRHSDDSAEAYDDSYGAPSYDTQQRMRSAWQNVNDRFTGTGWNEDGTGDGGGGGGRGGGGAGRGSTGSHFVRGSMAGMYGDLPQYAKGFFRAFESLGSTMHLNGRYGSSSSSRSASSPYTRAPPRPGAFAADEWTAQHKQWQQQQRQQQDNDDVKDVEIPIEVTLAELFTGTGVRVIERECLRVCPACRGNTSSGDDDQFVPLVTCIPCDGRGSTLNVERIGPEMIQQTRLSCAHCEGIGQVRASSVQCGTCAGAVYVAPELVRLDVPLVKGLAYADRMRFDHLGDEHPGTMRRDSFVVVLRAPITGDETAVAIRQQQERGSRDLRMTHTVPLSHVLTGFGVEFTHLDGKSYEVKCPGAERLRLISEPGRRVLRAPGLGLPKPTSPSAIRDVVRETRMYGGAAASASGDMDGDLLITLTVVMPSLSRLDDPATKRALAQALDGGRDVSGQRTDHGESKTQPQIATTQASSSSVAATGSAGAGAGAGSGERPQTLPRPSPIVVMGILE